MKKILICGYGNIGKKTYSEIQDLENFNCSLAIYDKKILKSELSLDHSYDFAFICVSTDKLSDGSCDITNVEECVSKIDSKIIIIKSTIPPGTSEYLQSKYPNKRIVFSPEFYGTTIQAPVKLNFLILGGCVEDCSKVADLFHLIKPASFRVKFTNYKTAELVKYMENCFLALKVQFCSEFFNIAETIGVNYNELRECFVLDERLGESHTYINPEQPYYDSHCLNKDVPGLIKFCEDKVEVPIMETVNRVNLEKKKTFGKE